MYIKNSIYRKGANMVDVRKEIKKKLENFNKKVLCGKSL